MAPRASASPKRLAVLLSGSGTTLQNLIDRIQSGTLRNAQISVVLSSRAGAGGLERARKHDIPTVLVESKRYRTLVQESGKTVPDWGAMSEAVTAALAPYKPDILVLAGYMCFYKLPPQWECGRCLNYGNAVLNANIVLCKAKVHPSLIPAFSGEGMYGDLVHRAVVKRGVKVCNVSSSDSWESVRDKVVAAEREALPEAIQLLIDDRLKVTDGIVEVVDD
ncbi:hypothetical protein FOL47_006531 [Perkinsus chesapeaki]|uniref:phosphoribosylglycinamide formyltransferase 1 n=1 Tax=Perkinsus chesapeaki TaxID=330153 RepID=A0A7J6LRC9_PERCH|nr:hypothetical protein FOL47_006531 [Perkinsus chesapeaki]